MHVQRIVALAVVVCAARPAVAFVPPEPVPQDPPSFPRSCYDNPPAPLVDLDVWLNAHPRIKAAITWDGWAYSAWDPQGRAYLKRKFELYWNENPAAPTEQWKAEIYDIPDPLTNYLVLADNDTADTLLIDTEAFALYAHYTAFILMREIKGLSSWSILEYDDVKLANILGSDSMFDDFTAAPGFSRLALSGIPAHPHTAYVFLECNDLLAPSRRETIGRIYTWMRDNAGHAGGGHDVAKMEHYWQYRGDMPVLRVLEGTIPNWQGEITHWVTGCHGSTAVFSSLLRAVGVPVVDADIWTAPLAGHSTPCFPTEYACLSHGDDPYSLSSKTIECYDGSAALISEYNFLEWFVWAPYATRAANIGRRASAVGFEHLSVVLIARHCADRHWILKGKAGREQLLGGLIFGAPQWFYDPYQPPPGTTTSAHWDYWFRLEAATASLPAGCGTPYWEIWGMPRCEEVR